MSKPSSDVPWRQGRHTCSHFSYICIDISIFIEPHSLTPYISHDNRIDNMHFIFRLKSNIPLTTLPSLASNTPRLLRPTNLTTLSQSRCFGALYSGILILNLTPSRIVRIQHIILDIGHDWLQPFRSGALSLSLLPQLSDSVILFN